MRPEELAELRARAREKARAREEAQAARIAALTPEQRIQWEQAHKTVAQRKTEAMVAEQRAKRDAEKEEKRADPKKAANAASAKARRGLSVTLTELIDDLHDPNHDRNSAQQTFVKLRRTADRLAQYVPDESSERRALEAMAVAASTVEAKRAATEWLVWVVGRREGA